MGRLTLDWDCSTLDLAFDIRRSDPPPDFLSKGAGKVDQMNQGLEA